MRGLVSKWIFTCVAVVFVVNSATPSTAAVIIDAYYQQVGVNGYYPDGTNYNDSVTTGPMSASAVSGFATIMSSAISPTTIGMSYSLGLSVDTTGSAFALQLVDFHVDTDTPYTFNMSAFPAHGFYDYNVGSIYSYTTNQYDMYNSVTDGSGFTIAGVLHSGQRYQYKSYTQIIIDHSFSGEITGHSSLSTVPEPSTFALAGLGGLGLLFGALRRRCAAA